jgi:hypothetical protein
MYYKDLTSYEYYLPFKLINVLNVGWLDKDFDFKKGKLPRKLVEKLYEILMKEGVVESRVNQIRGVHPCNLCETREFHSPFIGSCELWIPSQDAQIYFSSPSLVIHYIQEHNYCPPKGFVESVLQLDLARKFNGQEIYDDLIKAYSFGK